MTQEEFYKLVGNKPYVSASGYVCILLSEAEIVYSGDNFERIYPLKWDKGDSMPADWFEDTVVDKQCTCDFHTVILRTGCTCGYVTRYSYAG